MGTIWWKSRIAAVAAVVAGTAAAVFVASNDEPEPVQVLSAGLDADGTSGDVAIPTTLDPTTATAALARALPQALADEGVVDEDGSVLIDVLANDTNTVAATLAIASTPGNGSVATESDAVRYTPDADFAGEDAFTYEVGNGEGDITIAQVTVAVSAVNDAPVVPGPGVLQVSEDSSVSFNPLGGSGDVDGDPLALVGYDETTAAAGTVTDGSLVYTPPAGYAGPDSFTYEVTDGTVNIVVLVTIEVSGINDAPSGPAVRLTTDEDTPLTLNLLRGWSDPDGDTVRVAPRSGTTDAGGSIDVNSSGRGTYEPAPDYYGQDGFGFTITDGTVTVSVRATVTVVTVNDAPTVSDAEFDVKELAASGTVVGVVSANDPEGDAITFAAASSEAPFALSFDGTITTSGPVDFEAASGWLLSAIAADAGGAVAAFEIAISVLDVNEPPVLADSLFDIPQNAPPGTVIGSLRALDPDAGDAVMYRILIGAPAA